MADRFDSEPPTNPGTPVALQAQRSKSGEHVLLTRAQFEALTLFDVGSLLLRQAELEKLVLALSDQVRVYVARLPSALAIEAPTNVNPRDPRAE